jgi:hypothetical protein
MILVLLPLYATNNQISVSRGNENEQYEMQRLGTSGTSWAWGTASGDFLSLSSDKITSTGVLFNAWLANMPQLFLSFAYLNINTICTSMACAQEWNRLATSRKYLRVTKPVGQQRSTYFLQLPYRWSIPLMAISGILHWLLSQTFFLVRIDYFGSASASFISRCGFSVLCLMVFIGVALLLLTAIGVIGFWKMPMKMPIAGSCSLAISAACHPLADEIDPQLEMVQWGVVKVREGEDHGHCSLSSKPVTEPKYGETYR